MIEYTLLLTGAVALGICLTNWRLGLLVCLFVGCLQDPIRKIIPGEPVYLTVLIFIYAAATFFGAYIKGTRFSLRPIYAWNRVLKTPLTLFFIIVIIQSVVTLVRFNSPILAGIGFMAYISPVPAILLGYNMGRSEKSVQTFLKVYLLLNVLMISGIYFSYMGFNWSLLTSVGEGLTTYSRTTGEAIILRSGFYRAPEMAAWHAALSICFLVILFLVIKGNKLLRYSTGVLILFFWGGLLFTGRRKFILEIFVFLVIYGFLLLLLRESVSKTTRGSFLLIILLGVAAIGYIFLVPDEFKAAIDPYYDRGATVQLDATDRASLMTVEAFQWVIEQNGLLGSGAGTGSQGAQHFGGGGELVGYAAEGGVAKVLAELGVPGLIILIWLAISLFRYFWSIIIYAKNVDPKRAMLAYGLIAVLAANAIVFITAHQIFGDPFVLFLIGLLIGFVMAVPQMNANFTTKDTRALMLRRGSGWLLNDGARS
jgi:hypothetical protein